MNTNTNTNINTIVTTRTLTALANNNQTIESAMIMDTETLLSLHGIGQAAVDQIRAYTEANIIATFEALPASDNSQTNDEEALQNAIICEENDDKSLQNATLSTKTSQNAISETYTQTYTPRVSIEDARQDENLQKVFIKPNITTEDWVTATDIKNVKENIHQCTAANYALEHRADNVVAYAANYFLYTMDNEATAKILNKMSALDSHLQVEVGKLALRLRVQPNHAFSTHHQEAIKSNIAFTIVQGLMDINVMEHSTKAIKEIDEKTGRPVWRNQTFITYGYDVVANETYVHGVTLEPTILQKATKVRVGGKSTKLSGGEKMFLKNAGSTPLRLIDIDSSVLVEYAKSQEWYENVLDGTVNMDKIIANNLIRKQVAKFEQVQRLERFYMPLWLDYRTRLYYENSEMLFNPHGKTFETSLYELADARFITKTGFENLAYSAATIVDGRMAHHTALEKFSADPEYYLEALRETKMTVNKNKTTVIDFGKNLYNARLAQAIEDYNNEVPSRFLLGEDATNGGLQHGGIGFREPKMMIPSNVGGHAEQLDSHANLQEILTLATRDEAKDVHQPLLHGSSIQTVANVVGKTLADTKAMMRKAYGNAVFNIELIADWGTTVIDNNNTALMWTTSDGFKAQSIAYTESVPATLYALSSSTKQGYTQTKVHRDMPMLMDAKGRLVYGSVKNEAGETDKRMGGASKVRGLYANITHSIDGTALRYVIRNIKKELQDSTAGGVWKHDNFLVHPNDMGHARAGYKKALINEFETSSYDAAMDEICENFKGIKPMRPQLVKGNATVDMIINSHYYLAP